MQFDSADRPSEDVTDNCNINSTDLVADELYSLLDDWHLQMLAYSLLRLGFESIASGTECSSASSIKVCLEYALKEVVYNMLSWVRANSKQAIGDLIEELDNLFLHSNASEGSRGWYP